MLGENRPSTGEQVFTTPAARPQALQLSSRRGESEDRGAVVKTRGLAAPDVGVARCCAVCNAALCSGRDRPPQLDGQAADPPARRPLGRRGPGWAWAMELSSKAAAEATSRASVMLELARRARAVSDRARMYRSWTLAWLAGSGRTAGRVELDASSKSSAA